MIPFKLNKMRHIQTVEYYSAIKKEQITDTHNLISKLLVWVKEARHNRVDSV